MIKKYFKEILYTKEQIADKCKELAGWVNKTYDGSKDLILVGLLKGVVPFMAELMKYIEVPHVIDFMTVSSYEGALEQSNNFKVIMDLKYDIKGKDVLIVEDIVDSGRTLSKMTHSLKNRGPKSLRTITLLDKPSGRKVEFEVDKSGFIVPDEFLVGFGLDVKEKLRNAPYIGIFDKTKLDEL